MNDIFTQTDGYRVSVEAQEARVADAKARLVRDSENTLLNKFIHFYGNCRLAETTAELNQIASETTEGLSFDGSISLTASVYDTNGEKTVTIAVPVKANQFDLVSDDDLRKMISEATAAETHTELPAINVDKIEASLADFSLIDDGSNYLKVFHPSLDSGRELGVIAKDEYAKSTNKEALLTSILADNVNNTQLENAHELSFTGSFVEPAITVEAEKPWETKEEEEAEEKKDEEETQEKEASEDDVFLSHQADSYRQATESEEQISQAQFEKTTAQAANSFVAYLQSLNYHGVRVLAVNGTADYMVSLTASLFDKIGEKIISVSFPIKDNTYTLPNKETIHKVVAETTDLRTQIASEFEKETLETLQAIDELETYNKQATEAALEDEKISKTASNSGGTQYFGPMDTLSIDKHTIGLPDDTEIGAKAYVDGFWWQLTSKNEDNLSKEADSGSIWTFTKIAPEKGEPEITL